MVYLDSSATSPILPTVRKEIARLIDLSIENRLGNPSSLHSPGSSSKAILENARKTIENCLDAEKNSIIFTSGGTESNNTVIHTFTNSPVLVSKIEHPSILRPTEAYADPCIKIPVNRQGIVDLTFLENSIKNLRKSTKKRILVSVMLANNETGVIEPLAKISKIVQKYPKTYLHTDATQAIGKITVSIKHLGIDYLTLSGHKIGAPVGIGVLYVRPGAPYKPLILGGEQELSRRAGTSNVLLASTIAIAIKNAIQTPPLYQKNILPLKKLLATKLKSVYPSTIINTPQNSLPNIVNFSFPSIEGESIQLLLDLSGFAVSTGSACASGSLAPSHVLMALTNDPETAHGSIRFSFPLETTRKDIDSLLKALPPILTKLRNLSTLTKQDTHD